MKENFQIHIWLGLLLCLLGMSCSDDTPAKGDDPGNGNTELEVNEWIESVMRSDYLWNNDIPAQNKLDFSADPQTFFRSMLSLKDGKTRNGKHLYYYSYMYKPQNKMFHFCKTFCSKITLVNTIQNVILNPI